MHISPELYQVFLRGEISAEAFIQATLQHLLQNCSECGSEWSVVNSQRIQAAMEDLAGPERSGMPEKARSGAYLAEISNLEERLKGLREQRRKALREVKELLAVPMAERKKTIERARTRYRSPEFVELLLEESRKAIRHDSKESLNLASMVPVAIHWMAGGADPRWAARIQARALAYKANAMRVSGDARSADLAFRDMRRHIARHPGLSSAEIAEVDNLEAALRYAQCRYSEAETLLDRSILHARLADDGVRGAQALIRRGSLFRVQSQFEQALESYAEAAELLEAGQERFLWQCVITGQVNVLCELEKFGEASNLLTRHRHLYEDRDVYRASLCRHLEGRIALGRERWDDAEDAFTDSRDGYLEIGRDHDATIAAMELARALLEQGKAAEVAQMATEVLTIFQSRGSDREALSALLLIQEAAVSRRLTLALLLKTKTRFEEKSS